MHVLSGEKTVGSVLEGGDICVPKSILRRVISMCTLRFSTLLGKVLWFSSLIKN